MKEQLENRWTLKGKISNNCKHLKTFLGLLPTYPAKLLAIVLATCIKKS